MTKLHILVSNMNKLLSLFLGLTFAVTASATFAVDTVTIVHKPGMPAEQDMEISERSLDAHICHGDISCDDVDPNSEVPLPGIDEDLWEAIIIACDDGAGPGPE